MQAIIFMQIYRYPVVWCNRHDAEFFDTSVLKEVRILYPLSLPKIAMLLILKQRSKISFYFLNVLNHIVIQWHSHLPNNLRYLLD